MGIIAVSTRNDNTPLMSKSCVIIRQHRIQVNELVKDKGIPIYQYTGRSKQGLSTVFFKRFLQLQVPHMLQSPELYTNLLWNSGCMFSQAARPRPNWPGFMQHVFRDEHHSKSEILFLPIIDLNPFNDTCLYSTLIYCIYKAKPSD